MCQALVGLISCAVLVSVASGFRAAIDLSDRSSEILSDFSQALELEQSEEATPIGSPDDAVKRSLHGTSARLARWVGKAVDADAGVYVHTDAVVSASDFAGHVQTATSVPHIARGSRAAVEELGLVIPATAVGAGNATHFVSQTTSSGDQQPHWKAPTVILVEAATSALLDRSALHVFANLSRSATAALGLATPPLAAGATETLVSNSVPHEATFPSLAKDSSSNGVAAPFETAIQPRSLAPGDTTATSSEVNSGLVVAPVSLAVTSVESHVASATDASDRTSAGAGAGASLTASSAARTWTEVVAPNFELSRISLSMRGAGGLTLRQQASVAVFLLLFFFVCACFCSRNGKPQEKPAGRSQFGGRSVRFSAARPARPTTMSGKLADVEDVIRDIADGDHGSSSSEDQGKKGVTFGASWDALVPSPRAGSRDSSSSRSSSAKSPRDSSAQMLADVKALAKDLEGPVQKYPKSGRSSFLDGFRRLQTRYLVVVPRPSKEARDRRTAESDIARWRGGCLGWWESKEEYKKNERPKGYVMLGKVVDVKLSSKDKQAVTIEHRDQDMTCNLELLLPTQELARRFDSSLKDLLSKLND